MLRALAGNISCYGANAYVTRCIPVRSSSAYKGSCLHTTVRDVSVCDGEHEYNGCDRCGCSRAVRADADVLVDTDAVVAVYVNVDVFMTIRVDMSGVPGADNKSVFKLASNEQNDS